MSPADVCVVHLVWAPFGPERLRRFVESYKAHSAGLEHRFLVVFNGFQDATDLGPWKAELSDVPHDSLRTPAPVQDLDAYRYAAEQAPADMCCFLNSYSVLLAEGWLASLTVALEQRDVGLVGAGGSWASMRSLARYDLGLRGPYRAVFEGRREVRKELGRLGEARASNAGFWDRAPIGKLRVAARVLEQTRGFSPFPAPHVRTNGFMIARETLLSLDWPSLRRKAQAHRFESGANSITAQVRRRGLDALVVARDGTTFAPDEWHLSRTFWQGDQESLLVSDNQTSDYAGGDFEMRRFLARYAWGAAADPTPPRIRAATPMSAADPVPPTSGSGALRLPNRGSL